MSGRLYVAGAMAFVAEGNAEEGQLVSAVTRYEITYAKAAGPVAMGEVAYFDPGADVVTNASAAGLYPVGYFSAAAADAAATGQVVLTGAATAVVS